MISSKHSFLKHEFNWIARRTSRVISCYFLVFTPIEISIATYFDFYRTNLSLLHSIAHDNNTSNDNYSTVLSKTKTHLWSYKKNFYLHRFSSRRNSIVNCSSFDCRRFLHGKSNELHSSISINQQSCFHVDASCSIIQRLLIEFQLGKISSSTECSKQFRWLFISRQSKRWIRWVATHPLRECPCHKSNTYIHTHTHTI
jgi:predicted DNA-binding protein YlxM (UPF0122 family)